MAGNIAFVIVGATRILSRVITQESWRNRHGLCAILILDLCVFKKAAVSGSTTFLRRPERKLDLTGSHRVKGTHPGNPTKTL
jgi:hypothetical protein